MEARESSSRATMASALASIAIAEIQLYDAATADQEFLLELYRTLRTEYRYFGTSSTATTG